MDLGKFPQEFLQRLLAKAATADPRVVVGPKIGADAAVLRTGDGLLVAKSDPVTFATDRIGWYAVQVNANDIACMGATPRWFLATLLVPQRFSQEEAEAVFNQVLEACQALGVALVGGHSEVTPGLDRPIVVGSMLGEVTADKLVPSGGSQDGDSIVLTKGIAIEGTALLALERAAELRRAGVPDPMIAEAADFLTHPGISVVNDARIACATVDIHALHDPTEGGLITGLRELAQVSGLGLAVEEGSIPVFPQCDAFCQALGLNPLGLLASGALLITLPAGQVIALLSALEREGIVGWEIGQMLAPEEGLVLFGRGGEIPLPQFPHDELARYFSQANPGVTRSR